MTMAKLFAVSSIAGLSANRAAPNKALDRRAASEFRVVPSVPRAAPGQLEDMI